MTALRRLLVPRQTRSEVWRLVLPSVRMAVSQQQQVRHSLNSTAVTSCIHWLVSKMAAGRADR